VAVWTHAYITYVLAASETIASDANGFDVDNQGSLSKGTITILSPDTAQTQTQKNKELNSNKGRAA